MSDKAEMYEDPDKIEYEDEDPDKIEYEDEDPDKIEYEDEEYLNEDPTALKEESIPNEFREYITESKKKLYKIIVFGPKDAESAAAQDDTLLEKYIKELDLLGKSLIKVIKNPTGLILEEELKNYSSDTVSHVNDTLNYTNTFLKNNTNINKMLYTHYINDQFSIFPYFQLPYFPK